MYHRLVSQSSLRCIHSQCGQRREEGGERPQRAGGDETPAHTADATTAALLARVQPSSSSAGPDEALSGDHLAALAGEKRKSGMRMDEYWQ